MLTIPKILDTPEFYAAPLDYKWNEGTSTHFKVDAHNEKIGKALWTLNHKATIGLVTALGEWVYWRLSKCTDRPKVNQALEAQWAGAIDRNYFFDWEFDEEYLSDSIEGPMWTMLSCIEYPRTIYFNGGFFINKKVPNLVMLVRHICPDPKLFDRWFNKVMKKAAETFPAQYDRQEVFKNMEDYEDKEYDSSDEPAIPRDFFWEEDFDYQATDTDKIISNFISSLDYKTNNFLCTPEEMIEEGFQGTPYKYKPIEK